MAYEFGRLINHAQGFGAIRMASETYGWNIRLSEIARIWTNGCILKSAFMKHCTEILGDAQEILDVESTFYTLQTFEKETLNVVHEAGKRRVAIPALSAALNYWLALTTERSTAHLIQAQRDYFGHHTYRLLNDKDQNNYHTNWED